MLKTYFHDNCFNSYMVRFKVLPNLKMDALLPVSIPIWFDLKLIKERGNEADLKFQFLYGSI